MAYKLYADEEVRRILETPGFPLPGRVLDDLNAAVNRLAESPMALSGPPDEYLLDIAEFERLELAAGWRCFLCKVLADPYKYVFYFSVRCDHAKKIVYLRRVVPERRLVTDDPRFRD